MNKSKSTRKLVAIAAISILPHSLGWYWNEFKKLFEYERPPREYVVIDDTKS